MTRVVVRRGALPIVVQDYTHVVEDVRHEPTFADELVRRARAYARESLRLLDESRSAAAAARECRAWADELKRQQA